jgi:hypothetical protein
VPELHDSAFVRRGHLAPALSSTLSAPVLVLTQPWIVGAGAVLVATTDPAAIPPDSRTTAPTTSATMRMRLHRVTERELGYGAN